MGGDRRRLYRVVYISRCTDTGLVARIQQMSRNNEVIGITSSLLLFDEFLFQVLEGELEDVDVVFSKILQDSRHDQCTLLSRYPISSRSQQSPLFFFHWRDLPVHKGVSLFMTVMTQAHLNSLPFVPLEVRQVSWESTGVEGDQNPTIEPQVVRGAFLSVQITHMDKLLSSPVLWRPVATALSKLVEHSLKHIRKKEGKVVGLTPHILAYFNTYRLIGVLKVCKRIINAVEEWKRRAPYIDVQIGIHYGSAIVGKFGCQDQHMFWTGLGSTISIVNEIRSQCQHYQTRILMSQQYLKMLNTSTALSLKPVAHVETYQEGTRSELVLYTIDAVDCVSDASQLLELADDTPQSCNNDELNPHQIPIPAMPALFPAVASTMYGTSPTLCILPTRVGSYSSSAILESQDIEAQHDSSYQAPPVSLSPLPGLTPTPPRASPSTPNTFTRPNSAQHSENNQTIHNRHVLKNVETPLLLVAYVSHRRTTNPNGFTKTESDLNGEIQRINSSSFAYNSQHKITSCLLYTTHTFFHIMEGNPLTVLNTLTRISKDNRHKNVSVVRTQKTQTRLFPSQPFLCTNLQDIHEVFPSGHHSSNTNHFNDYTSQNRALVRDVITALLSTHMCVYDYVSPCLKRSLQMAQNPLTQIPINAKCIVVNVHVLYLSQIFEQFPKVDVTAEVSTLISNLISTCNIHDGTVQSFHNGNLTVYFSTYQPMDALNFVLELLHQSSLLRTRSATGSVQRVLHCSCCITFGDVVGAVVTDYFLECEWALLGSTISTGIRGCQQTYKHGQTMYMTDDYLSLLSTRPPSSQSTNQAPPQIFKPRQPRSNKATTGAVHCTIGSYDCVHVCDIPKYETCDPYDVDHSSLAPDERIKLYSLQDDTFSVHVDSLVKAIHHTARVSRLSTKEQGSNQQHPQLKEINGVAKVVTVSSPPTRPTSQRLRCLISDVPSTHPLSGYKALCDMYQCKPNSYIVQLLSTHALQHITSIDLSHTFVGKKGIIPVLHFSLQYIYGQVRHLGLSNNGIDNNTLPLIFGCCDRFPKLEMLDLSNNKSISSAKYIQDFVAATPAPLTTLNLHGCLLREDEVAFIQQLVLDKHGVVDVCFNAEVPMTA